MKISQTEAAMPAAPSYRRQLERLLRRLVSESQPTTIEKTSKVAPSPKRLRFAAKLTSQ